MTDWLYEEKIFEVPNPNPYEGFIYLIENLIDGKMYIGKKHFWTRRKSKKTKRRETKESDWKDYYSSSDELQADVKKLGKENFRRIILHLCIYKKQMTYLEQKEQWNRNVLLEDNYYNTNIGGKFFVREKKIYGAKEKVITKKNEKWREVRSENMKGDKNVAKRPEVRKKISEKKAGDKHHNYGKQISETHKKAIYESRAVSITDGKTVWETQLHYMNDPENYATTQRSSIPKPVSYHVMKRKMELGEIWEVRKEDTLSKIGS